MVLDLSFRNLVGGLLRKFWDGPGPRRSRELAYYRCCWRQHVVRWYRPSSSRSTKVVPNPLASCPLLPRRGSHALHFAGGCVRVASSVRVAVKRKFFFLRSSASNLPSGGRLNTSISSLLRGRPSNWPCLFFCRFFFPASVS